VDLVVIATVIIVAYLLGAIPFGLLIARLYGIKDVRTLGSGNIGATNVWRIAGAKAAIWVFALDIGKGVVAVILARLIHQDSVNRDLFMVVAGLAAILGHVFPIYLGFRGGKGVNTGLGVMVSLLPLETLGCVVVFAVVLAITRYVSLGSLLAALSLALMTALEQFWFRPEISRIYFPLTLLLAVVIVFTHRQNIQRLISGTENRFQFKSKSSSNEAGSHV
jgi:acyl phosphate:glycerol-3-phosphate acyltransferase